MICLLSTKCQQFVIWSDSEAVNVTQRRNGCRFRCGDRKSFRRFSLAPLADLLLMRASATACLRSRTRASVERTQNDENRRDSGPSGPHMVRADVETARWRERERGSRSTGLERSQRCRLKGDPLRGSASHFVDRPATSKDPSKDRRQSLSD